MTPRSRPKNSKRCPWCQHLVPHKLDSHLCPAKPPAYALDEAPRPLLPRISRRKGR